MRSRFRRRKRRAVVPRAGYGKAEVADAKQVQAAKDEKHSRVNATTTDEAMQDGEAMQIITSHLLLAVKAKLSQYGFQL